MNTVNRNKSKSSLFLMEMIVTILFFSIASAICVRLFAESHILSKQADELNMAVAVSQSFVEVVRGTDGSMDALLEQFPNAERINNDVLEQYYDTDYNECTIEEACYVAEITLSNTGAFQVIDTRFINLETKELVYELSATKYINTPQG
ncbi:MAG TPA: hypothetical protein VJZ01_02135 [Lachnospiraceae bacterium]|jgi:hypothetical protein|nr:hypothetical protein [Lachnospiraceae bacterium]